MTDCDFDDALDVLDLILDEALDGTTPLGVAVRGRLLQNKLETGGNAVDLDGLSRGSLSLRQHFDELADKLQLLTEFVEGYCAAQRYMDDFSYDIRHDERLSLYNRSPRQHNFRF